MFQMALRLIPESREAWEEVSRFLEIIYCIERKKEGRAVKRVKSGRERSRREAMKITLVTVGKIKEKFYTDAIAEYAKRLSRYCKLEIIQVADEKTPDKASEAEEQQIKDKEGKRILEQIKDGAFMIALAIDGKMLDSVELAEKIDKLGIGGVSQLVFVIGGSLGLSESVLSRADYRLSFSRMTFPHQLMRVILLEQIYRSYRIIHKEPYHK